MNSPLLALFSRSVREDTRQKGTYIARSIMGAFIMMMLMISALSSMFTSGTGLVFFIQVVVLQTISITLVGLSYFCSAVAEEKEEQTLGLLRMTSLGPLSILLGKSTSRLCSALLLLASQFPFTVFAVTLGGISLRQIIATYFCLGAYTFLLCNIALLGSVLTRTTPRASIFSIFALIVVFSAGPILEGIQALLPPSHVTAELATIGGAISDATPVARLMEVLRTRFSGSVLGWQVACNVMVGIGAFLLAWLAFERYCDKTSGDIVTSAPAVRTVGGVRQQRLPRPKKDGLAWKEYHFLCGGRWGMIIRCTIYGLGLAWVIYTIATTTSGDLGADLVGLNMFITFVFALDIAILASRVFRSEINGQTLSALSVLPLTMGQITAHKVRGCLAAATPGIVCVVVSGVLSLITIGIGKGLGGARSALVIQTLGGWASAVMLVSVVAWFSLSMKRGALPVGFLVTLAFYTFISILGGIFGMIMSLGAKLSNMPFAMSFMALSPLIGVLGNLVVAFVLYRQIPRRLEWLASEN